jgi:MFS family permease
MRQSTLSPVAARTLLANRNFVRLWAAQFSAVTVAYGLVLAGAALVEEQTHSSAQTGLVILSAILPAFLGSLVSGAAVDRWGRRPVLIISHGARAVIALGFWAGTKWLPPEWVPACVYAATGSSAVFSQFAMTAELALLPDLVEAQQLISANALYQLSMLAGEGLGIVVIAPALIKLTGAPAAGLAGAVLCTVALLLVLGLPKGARPAAESVGQRPIPPGQALAALSADLREGWRTIARDRLLSLVVLQITVAATLLLVLLALVPGLAARTLGVGVEGAPLLILPGGLAFFAGTILVARRQGRLSRPTWTALGSVGLGACIGLLALFTAVSSSVWPAVLAILGIGLSLGLVIVPARTVLQEHPPAEVRGRVIAAQLALANAAAVLPVLLGGALADRVGIQPVMGLLGLVAVGAGAVGLHRIVRWRG